MACAALASAGSIAHTSVHLGLGSSMDGCLRLSSCDVWAQILHPWACCNSGQSGEVSFQGRCMGVVG